jgi:hypothetical protein
MSNRRKHRTSAVIFDFLADGCGKIIRYLAELAVSFAYLFALVIIIMILQRTPVWGFVEWLMDAFASLYMLLCYLATIMFYIQIYGSVGVLALAAIRIIFEYFKPISLLKNLLRASLKLRDNYLARPKHTYTVMSISPEVTNSINGDEPNFNDLNPGIGAPLHDYDDYWENQEYSSDSDGYADMLRLDESIGDLTCEYNACSPYIRCAVHPGAETCEDCRDYRALVSVRKGVQYFDGLEHIDFS